MKSYLRKHEQKAVTQFIKKIRLQLGDNLLSARLFGSKVHGNFSDESDIDVLLILREVKSVFMDKIVAALIDFQLEYDANISPVIFSEHEYQVNTELGSPFVKNLEQKSILL
jgi:predicted nucleotidyltransferase